MVTLAVLLVGVLLGWAIGRGFAVTPADQWNEEHPIGAMVMFQQDGNSPAQYGRTSSRAWCEPSGRALVSIENRPEPVDLMRVVPVYCSEERKRTESPT